MFYRLSIMLKEVRVARLVVVMNVRRIRMLCIRLSRIGFVVSGWRVGLWRLLVVETMKRMLLV